MGIYMSLCACMCLCVSVLFKLKYIQIMRTYTYTPYPSMYSLDYTSIFTVFFFFFLSLIASFFCMAFRSKETNCLGIPFAIIT